MRVAAEPFSLPTGQGRRRGGVPHSAGRLRSGAQSVHERLGRALSRAERRPHVFRNRKRCRAQVSFSSSSARSTASDYEEFMARYGASSTASYEFYEAAAEEEMPAYRVERAKSGRSGCAQKGAAKKCGDDKLIALGALRVGSLDDANGGYGFISERGRLAFSEQTGRASSLSPSCAF